MKRIKIGIPRALLYYRYGILWKTFFESLGCKIILSLETTKEIIELGIKNTNIDTCISYKLYIGHALYLSDKCDYILVPRICNYGKSNQVCPKYQEVYEELREKLFKDYLIYYEIDHTKYKYEFIEFIKMGLKVCKNPIKIIYSYVLAKKKQNIYNTIKINEAKNKLSKQHKKVLLLSHIYNVDELYFTKPIITYLKNNNILTIKSSSILPKTAITFSEYFDNNDYLIYTKELIGSLYYYKYQVDGIIILSEDNCKPDKDTTEKIIERNKEVPILNLVINENISKEYIEKELFNFIKAI